MANETITGCYDKDTGKITLEQSLALCTCTYSGCYISSGVHAGQISLVLETGTCDDTYYGCLNAVSGEFEITIPDNCCQVGFFIVLAGRCVLNSTDGQETKSAPTGPGQAGTPPSTTCLGPVGAKTPHRRRRSAFCPVDSDLFWGDPPGIVFPRDDDLRDGHDGRGGVFPRFLRRFLAAIPYHAAVGTVYPRRDAICRCHARRYLLPGGYPADHLPGGLCPRPEIDPPCIFGRAVYVLVFARLEP